MQPFSRLANRLRNPAHLKFAFGEGAGFLFPRRVLTELAARASSWVKLVPQYIINLYILQIKDLLFTEKGDVENL